MVRSFIPKYNTLGQRFVKSVFPNPVPGGTPTVHILDVSLILVIYVRSWSLYYKANELNQVCFIWKSSKMCTDGVCSETGLGNTA